MVHCEYEDIVVKCPAGNKLYPIIMQESRRKLIQLFVKLMLGCLGEQGVEIQGNHVFSNGMKEKDLEACIKSIMNPEDLSQLIASMIQYLPMKSERERYIHD